MADTIEYSQEQSYTDESAQLMTTYDECKWKTFQRTEDTQTETGQPSVFIDDIDNLGQQGGVD